MTACTILPMHRAPTTTAPVAVPAGVVDALVSIDCANYRAMRFCERLEAGERLPLGTSRDDLARLLDDVRRAAAALPKGGAA